MNHLTTRLAIRFVLVIVSPNAVHADPTVGTGLHTYIPSHFKTCVPSKVRWGCAPPSCIDPETGLTRMEDEKFSCDGHDFGRARP